MKDQKLLLLIFFLFAQISISQNTFCDGWKKGYLEGYSYLKTYSLYPIIPLCPLPSINESRYNDGYNRGFLKGKLDGSDLIVEEVDISVHEIDENDNQKTIEILTEKIDKLNSALTSLYISIGAELSKAANKDDYNTYLVFYRIAEDAKINYGKDQDFLAFLIYRNFWRENKTNNDNYIYCILACEKAVSKGHLEAKDYLDKFKLEYKNYSKKE